MDIKQSVGFIEEHFNEDFFSNLLQHISTEARYISHEEMILSSKTGFSIKFNNQSINNKARVVGLRAFRLRYNGPKYTGEQAVRIIFKIKAKGSDSVKKLYNLFSIKGYDKLLDAYEKKPFNFISNTELKEIAVYNVQHPVFKAIGPKIFTTISDTDKDVYLIAMEDLNNGSEFSHLNMAEDLLVWDHDDVLDAFRAISSVHALYFDKPHDIPDELKTIITGPHADLRIYDHPYTRKFIRCSVEHNLKKFPDIFNFNLRNILQNSLDNMDEIIAILHDFPVTLVHADFTPRNMCFRKNPKSNEKRACIYDWEFVRVMNPQYDAALFISAIVPESSEAHAKWMEYLELYRTCFQNELEHIGAPLDIINMVTNKDKFKAVFDMCCIEMMWNMRGSVLTVTEFMPMPHFLPYIKSVCEYIRSFASEYPFLKAENK